jgi:hypothetical protein
MAPLMPQCVYNSNDLSGMDSVGSSATLELDGSDSAAAVIGADGVTTGSLSTVRAFTTGSVSAGIGPDEPDGTVDPQPTATTPRITSNQFLTTIRRCQRTWGSPEVAGAQIARSGAHLSTHYGRLE